MGDKRISTDMTTAKELLELREIATRVAVAEGCVYQFIEPRARALMQDAILKGLPSTGTDLARLAQRLAKVEEMLGMKSE